MRARAAAGPLRATACQYARSRFIQAQTFLTWTVGLGLRPSGLTQAHIDAYYAGHGTHQREGVRAFLVWAAGHGHIPGHLDIPRQQPYAGEVITQQRRLVLQVPAPVVADALGFHHTTTTRQHVKAGGPWSQYAGGDHLG